jgi:predicted nucleic acid-binding Zn ribbon protein
MSYINPPDPLSGILESLYKQMNFSKAAKEFEAIKFWSEVVGKEIAKNSEVEKIIGKTLFIKVKNAAWRNELTFRKPGIISKLNERLGAETVKEIVFK